ncbi:MAG TPA: TolC family protein [Gemmataceae bacterium]|nr:TolC family protein [Gemmataceae bacterium]
MGCKSFFGGLTLLLTILVGCKGRVFLTEDQLNIYKGPVPSNLQENPNVGTTPTIPITNAPPTLYNLDRQIRYLSLAEAVSIALEQGTVGQPSLLFPGIGLDNLIAAPQGSAPSGSDSIRVLAMDPATTASNIDASLAKFDAVMGTSMMYTATDQPIVSALQNLQAGGAAAGLSAIVQNQAQLQSGIYKPLPTGGVAGITFTAPYTTTNLPARLANYYQPSLQFTFEQPLLQGFGVEINQLRAFHPGSILPISPPNSLTAPPAATFLPYNFNNLSGVGLGLPPGILIARIRFNQNRAEFERNVNQMLLNVENAYWNLYGSYYQLYSREQGLRFAYETWKISGAQFRVGRVSRAALAQAEGQYNLFRSQRLQAIDTVLDNERQLRAMLGMQIEDGARLVPSDAPTLAEYRPDWKTGWYEAMQNRPELYMARQDVKVSQLNVQLAKNYLLPDLRSFLAYDSNSIGSSLDGNGPLNAFRNLASNTYNDWTVGLRLGMPLGFRFAHAQLRQSQLQLARAYLVLQDQELKAERFLGLYYRRMSSAYFQIKAARAQREAFATQLQIRYELYRAGSNEPGTNAPVTLNLLLESQRFWAEALATEYQSIVTYNNSIAGWEYAKGTILQHDNVTISEGPIPVAAQKRATEHLRERTKAIVLRERAAPTGVLANPLERSGPINIYPQINAQSLPSIYKDVQPLKDVGELPAAENANPEQDGAMPNPLEATPLNQIFPESELPKLPTGVTLPDIAPPAAPAAGPGIKTSAAPARSKMHRTTSTFGTARPADDPVSMMPIPVKPATPTPAANPSFAPATMPQSPLSALPPPVNGNAAMPASAQPILPLDPSSGH